MSNNTPETLASFKRTLAEALIAAAKAETLRHSRANNIAEAMGLPGVVDYDQPTTGYKVPDFPEETGNIAGRPRSDFTPEALARIDAETLHSYKRSIYSQLRQQVRWGDMSEDMATAITKATGLPQPETKSEVSVSVEGLGYTTFTLPGEVSEDDVRSKFAPKASHPMNDAVRELFPNAEGVGDSVSVVIRKRRTWPEYPAQS